MVKLAPMVKTKLKKNLKTISDFPFWENHLTRKIFDLGFGKMKFGNFGRSDFQGNFDFLFDRVNTK